MPGVESIGRWYCSIRYRPVAASITGSAVICLWHVTLAITVPRAEAACIRIHVASALCARNDKGSAMLELETARTMVQSEESTAFSAVDFTYAAWRGIAPTAKIWLTYSPDFAQW